jgi:sugar phosphate isomerase/epimerase
MLDDNGLKCCGTHTGIETLLGDSLAKTIEFNKTIGNKFLIVPGLAPKYRTTIADWKETAKLFNEASEKTKSQGMLVGYHNHSIEFQAIDGQIPWDVFFGGTKKDVVMQLDIGHAVHAGQDPVAVLKKYEGRAKTVHVKDYSPTNKAFMLGDGEVKWKEVLPACEKIGGTEWYIIEEETLARPGLEGIEICLKRLHEMGR